MRVRIDAAGRIVVPKALRDALGLTPDAELEITEDGVGLRLDPVKVSARSVRRAEDGLPVLEPVDEAILTDDSLRALVDELRR